MEAWRTLITVFPASLLSGLLISTVLSVLGVVVILKRMVFIGAALAEVAAAGVAAALVLGGRPLVGAAAVTVAAGVMLSVPFETGRLPRDAVIGALFVTAAATAILISAQTGLGLAEVKNLLYGDLIVIRRTDCIGLASVAAPVAAALTIWRRELLYVFLDREAARLLGIRVAAVEALFFVALSLTIAISSRAAGAMLSFGYLVLPAATALLLSRRWGVVLAAAAGLAAAATVLGLWAALAWELPANQLIVAFLAAPLLIASAARAVKWRGARRRGNPCV